jgi:hypothetical protein
MIIPSTPFTIADSEKAPEVMAVVQPNSLSSGLRKTPKVLYIPHDITIIKKLAITMI